MRALDLADQIRDGEERLLTVTMLDEDGDPLFTDRPVTGRIGQALTDLARELVPAGYAASYQEHDHVTAAMGQYTLHARPLTRAETAQEEAEEAVRRGEMAPEAYETAEFWREIQGDSSWKRLLLFGDADWDRHQVYATAEEAEGHMVTVQIPVWTLWAGVKSAATMEITVHEALAQDVVEIFTEIFEDPEQFPIESVGGFRYVEGTTGEHNNGTAIDINADANFQVRDGVAETGTHWTPGEDPFSIAPGGSVVRAFLGHGWTWGGGDWAGHVDPTTGYHDYMHFSYRGR